MRPDLFHSAPHPPRCRDTFCQVGMIMSCEEPDIRLVLQPRQSLVVTGTQRLPSPCRRLIDWPVRKRGNVLDSGQRRTSAPPHVQLYHTRTCESESLGCFALLEMWEAFWRSLLYSSPRSKTHSGVLNQQLSSSCSGGGQSGGEGWNPSNTVRQREECHYRN